MGIVIPFAEVRQARLAESTKPRLAVAEAISSARDQAAALTVARPLLIECRDRYGFVLMQDGLPTEPAVLGRALGQLHQALVMLDAEMGAPRTFPTFGVYLGRRKLAWFEDGYSGTTGLAVPNDVPAIDLAAFLRPRIAVAESRSRG